MEYVCHIYRNPRNLIFWTYAGARSVRLPLFDRFPKRIQKADVEGDFLVFLKEDRYSNNLIYVYPPSEITEEQFELINQKWNDCVENNLKDLEFVL